MGNNEAQELATTSEILEPNFDHNELLRVLSLWAGCAYLRVVCPSEGRKYWGDEHAEKNALFLWICIHNFLLIYSK